MNLWPHDCALNRGAPFCRICDLEALEKPNKGGRPPAAHHLQRINVPLRLPRWMVEWIDVRRVSWPDGTRADVIEASLTKAYKLKAPK